MTDKVLKTLLSRMSMKETWLIFFLLGIIMMNYPFLSIFNKAVDLLGIPILYLYLMMGWFLSILVILVFTKAVRYSENNNSHHGPH